MFIPINESQHSRHSVEGSTTVDCVLLYRIDFAIIGVSGNHPIIQTGTFFRDLPRVHQFFLLHVEAALPRLGRDIVVLHALHTGSGWAFVEMLNELFDRIRGALGLALDLQRSESSSRGRAQPYGSVGGISHEARYSEALGLFCGKGAGGGQE